MAKIRIDLTLDTEGDADIITAHGRECALGVSLVQAARNLMRRGTGQSPVRQRFTNEQLSQIRAAVGSALTGVSFTQATETQEKAPDDVVIDMLLSAGASMKFNDEGS